MSMPDQQFICLLLANDICSQPIKLKQFRGVETDSLMGYGHFAEASSIASTTSWNSHHNEEIEGTHAQNN
jgi:hypothetical protein